MKKIYFLLIFAILLSSCSLAPAPAVPTQTLAPTSSPVPTATPVTPTVTFTSTPTLVGQKTPTVTPILEVTSTQATETPISLTPTTPIATVEMKGFVSVSISDQVFYRTADCPPASVKFTAQVADVKNTAFVLLLVRFKSKQTGATGEWADSITMQSAGLGTYTHDLIATEMKGLEYFVNAWVQYQFVATDSDAKVIGRTAIFSEQLTLLNCEPTPTPTATATIMRP